VTAVRSDPGDELMATLMGLRVQGIGRLVKGPGEITMAEPRTLKSFAFVHLDGGGGFFESPPTGRREVRAGTLFVLFPGVRHLYGPRGADHWREHWAIFDGFIPERYRAAGLLDPARPFFEVGPDRDLLRRWGECLYLAEAGGAGLAQRLSERFFALIGQVLARGRTEPAAENQTRRLVEEVVALMEANLAEPGFRIEPHAERFAMSYSALRQRFATAAGAPPAAYLAKMRMGRAQARLLSGDEPVKTIAAELGFPDQYHFSRRFKQIVGLSPEGFRREFRAKERSLPAMAGQKEEG
jgi:AraC-like DNA-binding protein